MEVTERELGQTMNPQEVKEEEEEFAHDEEKVGKEAEVAGQAETQAVEEFWVKQSAKLMDELWWIGQVHLL